MKKERIILGLTFIFLLLSVSYFLDSLNESGLIPLISGKAARSYVIDFDKVDYVRVETKVDNKFEFIYKTTFIHSIVAFSAGYQNNEVLLNIDEDEILLIKGIKKYIDVTGDGNDDLEIFLDNVIGDTVFLTLQKVKKDCEPDWFCTGWKECINNMQERNCVDRNKCNDLSDKPIILRDCEGDCLDGVKNQNEEGIDCGGSCSKECKFELEILLWAGIPIILAIIIILISYIIVKIRERPYKAIERKEFRGLTKKRDEIERMHTRKEINALAELDEYVIEALDRGVLIRDIKDNLVDAGWPKRLVEDTIRKWKK